MAMILYPSVYASKTISITVKIENSSQKISFLMNWEHSNVYKDGEFVIHATVNIGSISPAEVYIHGTNRATVNYTYDPCGIVKYQDVRIKVKTYFYTSPERVMFFEGVNYVNLLPLYKVTITSKTGITEGSGEYPAGASLIPKVSESEARYENVTYRLSKWLVRVAGEEPYYVEDGKEIEVEQVTDIEAVYSKYYLVKVFSQYGYVDGGGWYEEGSVARFGVEPKVLSINETSEAFFSHWKINGVEVNNSFVRVDEPKTVKAVWLLRKKTSERTKGSGDNIVASMQMVSEYADREGNITNLVGSGKYQTEEFLRKECDLESQIRIMAVSPFGNICGTGNYSKGTVVFLNLNPTSFLVDKNVRLCFYGWIDLASGELIAEDSDVAFTAEEDKILQALWTLQYFVGGSWRDWSETIELLPPEVEYISNKTRVAFSGFWKNGSSDLIKSNKIVIQAWESVFVEPVMETQHQLMICIEGVDDALPIVIEIGNSSFTLNVTKKAQLWVREGDDISLLPPTVVGNMTIGSISGKNTSRFEFHVTSPETVEILYLPNVSKFEAKISTFENNEVLVAMIILALIVMISLSVMFRSRKVLSLEELRRFLKDEGPIPKNAWVEDNALESLKREDKELYVKALVMVSSGKLKVKPKR
ncbi:MAG: hypothetical protein QW201_00840 [Thermoproteota archaeon]